MKSWGRSALVYLVLFFIILGFLWVFRIGGESVSQLSYTEFSKALRSGEVASIEIEGNRVSGILVKDNKRFTTYVPGMLSPAMGMLINDLNDSIPKGVNGKPPAQTPFYLEIMPVVIISLLMFGLMWFMMAGGVGGGGANSKAFSFGKSKAKVAKSTGKRITFDDVAGLKEEKEELVEIVDFLKHPKRYTKMGARIPKGVLMVGSPGTGKTYLSRAVAGEAGVPFFSISGSDFVEMFVGVGASRVRDLFDEGKKNAPCIIFIDEIDAVGRKRGTGLGGGHDEREQTLNQILVEMDGFIENTGVIVMAATNRADVLDPALLRPGRFDRHINVGLPDIREREEIVKVHSRNKPLAPDVDFGSVAKATPGFSPADLENVMNEAALLTAKEKDQVIRMETIKKAIIKVVVGLEKKSRVVNERERKLTAIHEAGHAVLAYVLPDQDPVHQVTIIPRGSAGGFTLQFPDEDTSYMTKTQLESELVVLLGGRVAEEIMLEDISTGASNDLERVTKIARGMVTRYAMSDSLGSMSYDDGQEVFIGRDFGATKTFSDAVQFEIDQEIRKIVDRAKLRAHELLSQNRDKITHVADALLKYETLNAEEFKVVMQEGNEALDAFVEKTQKALAEDKKIREAEKAEREKKQVEEIKKRLQSIDAAYKRGERPEKEVAELHKLMDEAGMEFKLTPDGRLDVKFYDEEVTQSILPEEIVQPEKPVSEQMETSTAEEDQKAADGDTSVIGDDSKKERSKKDDSLQ